MKASVDPKFRLELDGRWPVYGSHTENMRLVDELLRRDSYLALDGKRE